MHFSKLLLDLLEAGQNERVKSLVKSSNLYNFTDSQGQTLLHHAAVCGNSEIIQYLLESGSDVNAEDEEGENALTRCLEVRQYATAQLLLNAGSDVSCLLHSLVMWSDAKGVKLLLDHGADIEEKNNVGATPLFYSYTNKDSSEECECENFEILQILLSSGASLMTCTTRGCFQITIPLMRGSRQAVRLILQSNVDFNATDNFEGKTILHCIAMNRNHGVAEELLPYVARFEIDALDSRYGSPLREAVSKGNVSMVEFLLDRKARVDFVCRQYRSTVLWSAFDNANAGTPEEYEKCVELLLQHKVDPQATMINRRHETVTIVDFSRLTNGFDKLKYVIAQMTINEKLGIALAEPTRSKLYSHPQSKVHLKNCRKILKQKVNGTISIFKLLTASDRRIEKYLSKKNLIKKLIRLRHKQQLKSIYKYYSNSIENRFTKVFLSKTLRHKAVSVISRILEYRVDETNIITEKIFGYLDNQDLRNLYVIQSPSNGKKK